MKDTPIPLFLMITLLVSVVADYAFAFQQEFPHKSLTSPWPISQIYHCGVLDGVVQGLGTSSIRDGVPERIMKEFHAEGCDEIKKAAHE